NDAPESDMARRRVDRLRYARGRPVAVAIIRRTQIGAALQDFPRDFDLRLPGIVARLPLSPSRIAHDAARALDSAMVLVPIGGPFPDVAGHVVEAIAVGRKRADGSCPLVAVLAAVLPGKLAL